MVFNPGVSVVQYNYCVITVWVWVVFVIFRPQNKEFIPYTIKIHTQYGGPQKHMAPNMQQGLSRTLTPKV